MRFHFVTFPINKKSDGKEEVAVEFRDSLKPERSSPGLVLTWHRGPKEDWANPLVELAGDPAVVIAQSKILRALDSFCENGEIDLTDPDRVLVHIERAKGEQVVLVNKEYLPVRRVDGDATRWAAIAADKSQLLVVAADDEADAKKTLGRQLMAMTDEDADLVDQVSAWMKSGKPVKKIEKDGAIKIHPLDVYCKRGHQRAAAEKKEKDSGKKMTIPAK